VFESSGFKLECVENTVCLCLNVFRIECVLLECSSSMFMITCV
jgi:hypothetical protein